MGQELQHGLQAKPAIPKKYFTTKEILQRAIKEQCGVMQGIKLGSILSSLPDVNQLDAEKALEQLIESKFCRVVNGKILTIPSRKP